MRKSKLPRSTLLLSIFCNQESIKTMLREMHDLIYKHNFYNDKLLDLYIHERQSIDRDIYRCNNALRCDCCDFCEVGPRPERIKHCCFCGPLYHSVRRSLVEEYYEFWSKRNLNIGVDLEVAKKLGHQDSRHPQPILNEQESEEDDNKFEADPDEPGVYYLKPEEFNNIFRKASQK